MTTVSNKKLLDSLLELKVINEESLKNSLNKAEKNNIPLYESLINDGLIPEKELYKILADILKISYVETSEKKINREIYI